MKENKQNRIFDNWVKISTSGGGRIAILMSGSGSNAVKLLENRNNYNGNQIVAIFTDNPDSNAKVIAQSFNVEYMCRPAGSFNTELERKKYFNFVSRDFREKNINLLLYAGFMKIVPVEFCSDFPGINSHPADLTVKNSDGKPKYVGMPVIKMAIDDGQETICCSCCTVSTPVDSGLVISQSQRLSLSGLNTSDINEIHKKLKTLEWEYYPKTIQMLSSGKISYSNIPYKFNDE